MSNWLTSIFNRRGVAPRDPTRRSPGFGSWWANRFVPVELRLSEEEMVSADVVYAAVRHTVDPLAQADWAPLVRTNGKRENLPDSNLHYLLNVRANKDMSAYVAKQVVLTQMLIYGDGYAYLTRDNGNRIIAWEPLDSERCRPVGRDEEERLIYEYRQDDGATLLIPARDLLHFRGNSIRGLTGDSVIARAAKAIALGVAAERFATTFFSQGANLGGYLKLNKPPKDQTTLDRMLASWRQRNAGMEKSHGTAIVVDGEYVQLTSNASQTQMIESRTLSVQSVARYFKIPLTLLQDPQGSQGYGSMTVQFYEMYVRTCLGPYAKGIAQECTYKLLPQKAPWPEVEVQLDFLTRGNAAERAATNAALIASGQATINECRQDEGKDTIKNGDVPLINGQPLDRLVAPPPPPPVFAPAQEEDEEGEQSDEAEAFKKEKGKRDEAMMNALVAAFEKHQKRVSARKADLVKANKTEAEIAENLATLTQRVEEEVAPLFAIAGIEAPASNITTAVASLAHVSPSTAATHLLKG